MYASLLARRSMPTVACRHGRTNQRTLRRLMKWKRSSIMSTLRHRIVDRDYSAATTLTAPSLNWFQPLPTPAAAHTG
jgi:hypothetical protein